MKTCLTMSFLPILFSLLLVTSLAAQDNQSLADLARKERQRKEEQGKKAKVLTNDEVGSKDTGPEREHKVLSGMKTDTDDQAVKDEKKSAAADPATPATSPEKTMKEPEKQSHDLELSESEQRGLRILVGLASLEDDCWNLEGHYVPLLTIVRIGCGGPGNGIKFAPRKGYDPYDDPDYQYSVIIKGDTCEVRADPNQNGHAGFYFDGDELYYNPSGFASSSDQALRSGQIRGFLENGTTKK